MTDFTYDELEDLADLVVDKMEIVGDSDSPHYDPEWNAQLTALRAKLIERMQAKFVEVTALRAKLIERMQAKLVEGRDDEGTRDGAGDDPLHPTPPPGAPRGDDARERRP